MTPPPTALATPAASMDTETPLGAAHRAECRIRALAPLSGPSPISGFWTAGSAGAAGASPARRTCPATSPRRVPAKTAPAHMYGARLEDVRRYAECPGCGGPHGRPQALGAAEGWELSLTHSGDVVAVALAEGRPVGLDVEQFAPRVGAGIAEEFKLMLTAAERASAKRLPLGERDRACLTQWAREEAFPKNTGEGLNTPVTGFTLSAPDAPAVQVGWHSSYGDGPVPAMVDAAPAEGCHTAVAVLDARTVLSSVHDGARLMTAGRPGGGHTSRASAGRGEPPAGPAPSAAGALAVRALHGRVSATLASSRPSPACGI